MSIVPDSNDKEQTKITAHVTVNTETLEKTQITIIGRNILKTEIRQLQEVFEKIKEKMPATVTIEDKISENSKNIEKNITVNNKDFVKVRQLVKEAISGIFDSDLLNFSKLEENNEGLIAEAVKKTNLSASESTAQAMGQAWKSTLSSIPVIQTGTHNKESEDSGWNDDVREKYYYVKPEQIISIGPVITYKETSNKKDGTTTKDTNIAQANILSGTEIYLQNAMEERRRNLGENEGEVMPETSTSTQRKIKAPENITNFFLKTTSTPNMQNIGPKNPLDKKPLKPTNSPEGVTFNDRHTEAAITFNIPEYNTKIYNKIIEIKGVNLTKEDEELLNKAISSATDKIRDINETKNTLIQMESKVNKTSEPSLQSYTYTAQRELKKEEIQLIINAIVDTLKETKFNQVIYIGDRDEYFNNQNERPEPDAIATLKTSASRPAPAQSALKSTSKTAATAPDEETIPTIETSHDQLRINISISNIKDAKLIKLIKKSLSFKYEEIYHLITYTEPSKDVLVITTNKDDINKEELEEHIKTIFTTFNNSKTTPAPITNSQNTDIIDQEVSSKLEKSPIEDMNLAYKKPNIEKDSQFAYTVTTTFTPTTLPKSTSLKKPIPTDNPIAPTLDLTTKPTSPYNLNIAISPPIIIQTALTNKFNITITSNNDELIDLTFANTLVSILNVNPTSKWSVSSNIATPTKKRMLSFDCNKNLGEREVIELLNAAITQYKLENPQHKITSTMQQTEVLTASAASPAVAASATVTPKVSGNKPKLNPTPIAENTELDNANYHKYLTNVNIKDVKKIDNTENMGYKGIIVFNNDNITIGNKSYNFNDINGTNAEEIARLFNNEFKKTKNIKTQKLLINCQNELLKKGFIKGGRKSLTKLFNENNNTIDTGVQLVDNPSTNSQDKHQDNNSKETASQEPIALVKPSNAEIGNALDLPSKNPQPKMNMETLTQVKTKLKFNNRESKQRTEQKNNDDFKYDLSYKELKVCTTTFHENNNISSQIETSTKERNEVLKAFAKEQILLAAIYAQRTGSNTVPIEIHGFSEADTIQILTLIKNKLNKLLKEPNNEHLLPQLSISIKDNTLKNNDQIKELLDKINQINPKNISSSHQRSSP